MEIFLAVSRDDMQADGGVKVGGWLLLSLIGFFVVVMFARPSTRMFSSACVVPFHSDTRPQYRQVTSRRHWRAKRVLKFQSSTRSCGFLRLMAGHATHGNGRLAK